jgi:hypothetical protein
LRVTVWSNARPLLGDVVGVAVDRLWWWWKRVRPTRRSRWRPRRPTSMSAEWKATRTRELTALVVSTGHSG